MIEARTKASSEIACMEVWGGNRSTDQLLSRPGLDVHVWSQCTGETCAGGDIHYISSCASGRITRMLMADICACGSGFSRLATEFRSLMMQNVNAIKQARLIRNMNERLKDHSDCGSYATALIATYFSPSRSFSLCNAGHPPPFIYSADRNAWRVLRKLGDADSSQEKDASGVIAKDEYQHFSTQLDSGDMVLSYSNLLAECRDSNGQMFGISGILDLLQLIPAERPADIVKSLLVHLRAAHPENLIGGDATLMLCRTTDRRVGWKNNLLAPLRLLRPVSNNTQFE